MSHDVRRRTSIDVRALALTIALVTAVIGLSRPAPAAAEFSVALDRGHVDLFALTWQDDQLRLQLQEDVTGQHVLRPSDSVLLQVRERARITLPDPVPARLSFLGGAGQSVFFLPQTQAADLLWPGWSTERLAGAGFQGPVQIHVDAVTGPGTVHLWQTAAFGGSAPVLTSGSYQLPGTISVGLNAHVHANWAFSAPGRYTLTAHASGVRSGGATVSSPPATYTFDVGDQPVGSPSATPSVTGTPTHPVTPSPADDEPTNPSPSSPGPRSAWDVRNGHVNKVGATVLNAGHVDIASVLEGRLLATKVKDTTASSRPVWRSPTKTVLQLKPGTKTKVPDDRAYAFLGSPGSAVFQVAQTQRDGVLWPGWSTEAIATSATKSGVTWALDEVDGPGDFALFETDAFGQPTVLFDSSDGLDRRDRFAIPPATHAHGSWAFTARGSYCLTMQRVAQLSSGQRVADRFSLAVAVGKTDVSTIDPRRCGKTPADAPLAPPPSADDTANPRNPESPTHAGTGTKRPAGPARAAACQRPLTVLERGHVDLATRVLDGALQSEVGDDSSGSKVYREPSDTVLWLKPSSRVVLPSGYGAVGDAGAAVWQVPQTQDPALIWLGWNTESLGRDEIRGPVTWRLDRVDGPGTVKVYLAGAFGGVQEMVLDGAGSSYSIPLGVHAHANWAFSRQGIYRLTMTQRATLASGRPSSDTETLTVAVGDVDPNVAGGAGCATRTRSEDGPAEGSAVGTPPGTGPSAEALPLAPVPSPVADGVPHSPAAAATLATPTSTTLVPVLLGTLSGLLFIGAFVGGALWGRSLGRRELSARR